MFRYRNMDKLYAHISGKFVTQFQIGIRYHFILIAQVLYCKQVSVPLKITQILKAVDTDFKWITNLPNPVFCCSVLSSEHISYLFIEYLYSYSSLGGALALFEYP